MIPRQLAIGSEADVAACALVRDKVPSALHAAEALSEPPRQLYEPSSKMTAVSMCEEAFTGKHCGYAELKHASCFSRSSAGVGSTSKYMAGSRSRTNFLCCGLTKLCIDFLSTPVIFAPPCSCKQSHREVNNLLECSLRLIGPRKKSVSISHLVYPSTKLAL